VRYLKLKWEEEMADQLPSTTGNPMEDFRKRVLDKLKTDIGSLMPDEVLAGLVQQAVMDTFFKKERVPKPGRAHYSTDTVEVPSWFAAEVSVQIEPKLKSAVAAYIEEHKVEIDGVVRAALDKDKLLLLTATVMADRMRDGLAGVAREFVQELQNKGLIRY
jgi:hypothetical protein